MANLRIPESPVYAPIQGIDLRSQADVAGASMKVITTTDWRALTL